MRKIHVVLFLMAIFSIKPVLADDMSMTGNTEGAACNTIAKACLDAGFVRTEAENKQFWQDCMKPILLGKTVAGVTVDTTTVKTCRVNKIAELKNEIKDLQSAS